MTDKGWGQGKRRREDLAGKSDHVWFEEGKQRNADDQAHTADQGELRNLCANGF